MEDELKRALGNLDCADAYVRCEMRAELLSAFARHMPAAYRLNVNAACPVGSEAFAAKIWELLRRKDFLFRLWPDSFLPAALAELPPGVADAGTKYVFQNTRPVLSENGIFFPNLRGECAFAVSDENFVAIHSEGQIRIADMKAGILTRIAQDSIREKCFLYWTRNALTVRGERVRIQYEFSPEKMELIEQRRETCPSWDKLWELGDISTETDWRESDGYRWSGQYGESIFYRGSDGAPKWELLLCRPERSLMFRVRGKLAAFILDETILEVVDLERRVILFQSREYDAITRAEWTPSGRQLLLVLRGNILVQLEIDPAGNGSPMSAAVENYGKYQWNKYNDKLNHYGRGVYWLMFGNEPNSSMFGALSMRHGWAAIYYPSDIGNTVKIYRLKNSRDMDYAGEYFVDKVQDNLDAPLYPARDRNALIVRAKKPILFDLTSLYEKRTLPPGELLKNESQKSDLSPYSDLRERYAKEMAEKLPLRASVPPKRNFIACLRSFFQGEERHYQHIEIIDGGNGFNWLIDKENGLIHAFNQSTSVFRDMLGRRILAADSHKDGLYLLLENVPHIIEIRLV